MKQQEKQAGATVFYSYAHEDESLREQLEKHLSMLRRQGLISEWHDRQIAPGTEWGKEIDTHLETASVVLLLVSPDFLASDYCYDVEMQRALQRHQQGNAHVIPIILRPCDWQKAPFADLQVLPRDGKPVMEWADLDAAFLDIAQGLRRVIELQTPLTRSHFPLASVERRHRNRLLNRVRVTWIEGLLEQSLHQAAGIDLHLQERPDALKNLWRFQVQEFERGPRSLPAETTIAQVYDKAEGELLILGEPGSGKTTLLLQLAQTLLDRAKADERCQMPVVFHLSSWAKSQPLADWLVKELSSEKYEIPLKVSEDWIDNGYILPLLDGLDEMPKDRSSACIQAINDYRQHCLQTQGKAFLVVCCRSEDYQTFSSQLSLQCAVQILPLTNEQIDDYFSSAGSQFNGLRHLLRTDARFAELLRTPLLLNILVLTFQGKPLFNFPSPDNFPSEDNFPSASSEQMLQIIFATYAQQMLIRRGHLRLWKQEQFLHWLSFIAESANPFFSVNNLDYSPPPLSHIGQLLEHGNFSPFLACVLCFTTLVYGLAFWIEGMVIGSTFGWTSEPVRGWVIGASALIFGLLMGFAGDSAAHGEDFIAAGPISVVGWAIGWREARREWRRPFPDAFPLWKRLLYSEVYGGLIIERIAQFIWATCRLVSVGRDASVWEWPYQRSVYGPCGNIVDAYFAHHPRTILPWQWRLASVLANAPLGMLLWGLLGWLVAAPVSGLVFGLIDTLLGGLAIELVSGQLSQILQRFFLRFLLWRTNYLP